MDEKFCRISKKNDLITVCDFGKHALCGYFPSSTSENLEFGRLSLAWSPSSELLQLEDDLCIDNMYGENYGYRSGLNTSMISHLERKVKYLISIVGEDNCECVLDIGSNDGTLLSFYPKNVKRIGMDPTIKKFKDYYSKDIKAIPEFFDANTFLKNSNNKKADIITSIAMFYDLKDPNYFVANIAECLSLDGIWNLEQSYMPSMLSKNAYDTVCQEHIEYYSLKVIKDLLEANNLKVIDVAFNNINGGSFSVIAGHKNSKHIPNNAVINWILSKEYKLNLHTPTPYREFEHKAYQHKNDLMELIHNLNSNGKRIAGYGASTKGNVILQFCNISAKDIFGIAEVNPDKFGKFTPVTNIPIKSENEIKDEKPDYLLVLPWHFRENIISREQAFIRNGGKLIFPLPEIEIVADE